MHGGSPHLSDTPRPAPSSHSVLRLTSATRRPVTVVLDGAVREVGWDGCGRCPASQVHAQASRSHTSAHAPMLYPQAPIRPMDEAVNPDAAVLAGSASTPAPTAVRLE